ncbi:MAG: universal stress protein [Chloroflexi bacterium]|nr:universal stress protein [Chloroflexota bacterium]MBL7201425.1 universal stress protein [Anaerolineae bacterium]
MFPKILFAHDGGMLAERAMVYLEHVARVESAEVIVLHVYQLPERYSAADGYETLCAQYEMIAQEIVEDVVSLLQERDVTARGIAVAGDSAFVILETAGQEDVSLIVIGSRGPSSMAELMLGSVSLEVLRHARCPVLVVP